MYIYFSIQWPTCTIRSPIYSQIQKLKIRRNIEYWRWGTDEVEEEVVVVDSVKATDTKEVLDVEETDEIKEDVVAIRIAPYNNHNGVDTRYISRYFRSANWKDLQGDGWEYFIRKHRRAKAGGGCCNDSACRIHGRGGGQHISETETYRLDSGRGGCGHRGRGSYNGARFGGGVYWLWSCVTSVMHCIFKWKPWHGIQVSISPYTTGMRRNFWQVKRRKVISLQIKNCTTMGTQACEEFDTRDDTLCGGKNFWLHELTVKSCSVSPFSSSYDLMQDMHIYTWLAAYTDKYGRNWILVLN